MPIVKRYFLEIKKDNFKKDIEVKFPDKINIYFQKEKDIDLNKFFYRQIGKEFARVVGSINFEDSKFIDWIKQF